jgi:hypothetical protein
MRPVWLFLALALAACTPDPALLANIRTARLPNSGTSVQTARAGDSPSPSTAPTSAPSPSATASASLPSPVVPSPPASPVATPTATPVPAQLPAPAQSPVLGIAAAPQPKDTWQTGPSLQHPRAGLVAAAVGGVLYAIEGDHRASLEWIATDVDPWTSSVAPEPGDGSAAPIGRSLATLGFDAKRLVGAGGDDSAVLDDVFSYNQDGAILAGRLPVPVMAAAGGLVGDNLVVAGGLDAQRHVTSGVRILNLQDQTTHAGKAMPMGVVGAASAVFNDRLYVFGGYTIAADGSTQPQSSVQVYDVAKDTWQRDGDGQSNSPVPLVQARHSAAAAASGGRIYLVGGAGTGNGVLPSLVVYDPLKNVWQDLAPIPTGRALHGLAAYGGRLWAIGGHGADGRLLTSVEIYQP